MVTLFGLIVMLLGIDLLAQFVSNVGHPFVSSGIIVCLGFPVFFVLCFTLGRWSRDARNTDVKPDVEKPKTGLL